MPSKLIYHGVGFLILNCKAGKAWYCSKAQRIQTLGGQLIIATQPGQGIEVTDPRASCD